MIARDKSQRYEKRGPNPDDAIVPENKPSLNRRRPHAGSETAPSLSRLGSETTLTVPARKPPDVGFDSPTAEAMGHPTGPHQSTPKISSVATSAPTASRHQPKTANPR
jgi:hypothetical protein